MRYIKILLIMVVIVGLAACGESDADDATPIPPTTLATQAPTQPRIPPTRIVTAEPTRTPQPTPTLTYAAVLEPLVGSWALYFDIELQELAIEPGATIQTITYTTSIKLQVNMDGTITAQTGLPDSPTAAGESGLDASRLVFNPRVSQPYCNPDILHTTPLQYTIDGDTFVQDGAVWARVTIVPDYPRQLEHYRLTCVEYQDVRDYQAAILWPALDAANWLEWTFPIDSGYTQHLERELTAQPGTMQRQLSGTLIADIRLARN
jgi:hypothetical protein